MSIDEKKLKSYLAKAAKDMLDESMAELGGLSELSIKIIHFFLNEFMGIYSYKMNIDYKGDPKQVIIRVFDDNNNEIFIRIKNEDIFKALAIKADVPNYIIRFAKRGDRFD